MSKSENEKLVYRITLPANSRGVEFFRRAARMEKIPFKVAVEAALDAWTMAMNVRSAEEVANQMNAVPKSLSLTSRELEGLLVVREGRDEIDPELIERKAPILAECFYRAQHQYHKAKAEAGRANIQKRWKS